MNNNNSANDGNSGNKRVSDHLANERTFLAWIRTSIGIMAFGFVVVRFSLFIRQLTSLLDRPSIGGATSARVATGARVAAGAGVAAGTGVATGAASAAGATGATGTAGSIGTAASDAATALAATTAKEMHDHGHSAFIGIVLVASGLLTTLFAFIRFKKTEAQIESGDYRSSSPLIWLVTAFIVLISVLLIIYLLQIAV